MKGKRRKWKQGLALMLAAVLLVGQMPVYAEAQTETEATGFYEHHTIHTKDCGYAEEIPGTDCNHVHDQAACGFIAAVEGVECNHQHDEAVCTYKAAVPASPCNFDPATCEECAKQDGSEEQAPVCAGLEGCADGAHAAGCPLYEEPQPTCNCEAPCTEEAVNKDCPVCGAEGADLGQCKGTPAEPACDCTTPCAEGAEKADCPVCTADLTQCKGVVPVAALAEAVPLSNAGPFTITKNGSPADVTTDYTWDDTAKKLTINTTENLTISMAEGHDSATATIVAGNGTDDQQIDLTLTLAGVNITGVGGNPALSTNGDLAITLQGDNTLTGGSDGNGIFANTLTINGPGTLQAQGTSSQHGIQIKQSVTITGGTVTATGGNSNGTGISFDGDASDKKVIISGGNVTANGGGNGKGIGGQPATFSTTAEEGTNGTAIIHVSSFGNGITKNENELKGIIFEGNAGKVYGEQTLGENFTIASGETLTVPSGAKLTVPSGKTLTIAQGGTLTVENGGTLENNGTITGSGTLNGSGTLTGSGTVTGITNGLQKDSEVSVTFSNNSATYGSTVTITATISQATTNALARTAAQNEVEFFVGADSNKQSLGTGTVSNNTATLEITLSGNTWSKGFRIGDNTITAEYGGSMTLTPKNGSNTLTVTCDHNGTFTAETAEEKYLKSAATCMAKAVYYKSCSVCGTSSKGTTGEATFESGDFAAHNMTHHTAKAATCSAAGNKEYWSCSECLKNYDSAGGGNVIADVVIAINPTNHTNTTSDSGKLPTCLESGYAAGTYCNDCAKWISGHGELAAKGHSFGEKKAEVPATCTAAGTKAHKDCSVCLKHFAPDAVSNETADIVVLTIAMKAHSFGNLIPEKAATTTQEGMKAHYVCSSCNGYFDENKQATTAEALTIPKKESGGSGSSGGSSGGGGSNEEDSDDNSGGSILPPPVKPEEPKKPIELPTLKPSEPKPVKPNYPIKVESDKEEPFIKGDDGKGGTTGSGWGEITDKTEAAKPGDTVKVDMNGATTVPGVVLESIAGKDITVVFDMGDGILWTVNGLSVTAENIKDIKLSISRDAKGIPVDVINNVTGERYSMNISLDYEGEFGFTATLTINMDKKNAGLYANLFYYNPKAEAGSELEFICADIIDNKGNADLEFTHASDYTIVIDKASMDPALVAEADVDGTDDTDGEAETAGTLDDATATVDSDNASNSSLWVIITVIVILALAGIAAYVYFMNKRRDEE